ncbi:MAG: enoyl-CoA hydratase/isomerase family protein [Dehalococcoidia bacterium]|nr:enoyl-CoA hydratase/isomerase family protein [Dehalococcoidia bacterium]
MQYEDLLLEKKDNIAVITFNVPRKLNALTRGLSKSIVQVCKDLAQDDDTRVVIVTGAGRGFCSGADVSMLPGSSGTVTATPKRFEQFEVIGPYGSTFPSLNKPIIAAVNGPCVGAGFSLALSCDIRIASDEARFCVAQVNRGLVPDAGLTLFLPLVAGISNAFELMYTADIIDASRAKEMGIVSKVVPGAQLMETAMELASRIAQKPPYSLELTKKMVWRGLMDKLTRQLDLESWAQRICFTTEDHQASVQAFLNKQPPPEFRGR